MDAAQMISEYIEDTRGLEGALLTIYAKTLGKKEQIDTESVKEYFHEKTARSKRKISPSDVIKTVCSYYDIKQSQIKSATRLSNIALPRQIIMYLLRHEYKLKLEEVATILKRKDHTTIIHGVDKVGRMVMKDPDFKEDVNRIVSMLDQST
jgi:chromosomal replication initiator protein